MFVLVRGAIPRGNTIRRNTVLENTVLGNTVLGDRHGLRGRGQPRWGGMGTCELRPAIRMQQLTVLRAHAVRHEREVQRRQHMPDTEQRA